MMTYQNELHGASARQTTQSTPAIAKPAGGLPEPAPDAAGAASAARPSRRSLMAGLSAAAAGIAARGGVALAAPAGDPDAALLELGRRYDAALAAEDAAYEAMEAITAAYHKATPAKPDALRRRPADDDLELRSLDGGDWFGRRDVADFQETPRRRRTGAYFESVPGSSVAREISEPEAIARGGPDDIKIVKAVVRRPCAAAQARADKIMAAWDEYQGACDALSRAIGRDDADAALESAFEVRSAIGDAIVTYRATTLQGLAVRARIVAALRSDDDHDEAYMPTDEKMLLAIVRDLVLIRS